MHAGNTKELAKKETKLRKKIESGIYTDNRNITLDEYFKYWTGRKRKTIKSNTLRNYTCNYDNHIAPYIGKTRKHLCFLASKNYKKYKHENYVVSTTSPMTRELYECIILVLNIKETT